jgi:hypothetical protein
MDKSRSNKSYGHKSRHEIEQETGEMRLYRGESKNSKVDPVGFVDFNFPTFFPGINMDDLFDFDQMARDKEKKMDHLGEKIGDFPIEMAESHTLHDLQIESPFF